MKIWYRIYWEKGRVGILWGKEERTFSLKIYYMQKINLCYCPIITRLIVHLSCETVHETFQNKKFKILFLEKAVKEKTAMQC